MADVFISYAHEDQAFARRMVPALEAEGFSVWWDHTIPPGQSWDTFIARNIEDARCCIVLWSARSVGSDWVKEEATLAKDAGKLIPVQIDAETPPVGFRRIQAAQLVGWNGDANNAQWKLLVGEVRRIVGASREGGAPSPRPTRSFAPPPASKTGFPWGIVGGVAAAALAITAMAFFYNQWQRARDDAVILQHQLAEQTEQAAATSTSTATPTTVVPSRDRSAEAEHQRSETNPRPPLQLALAGTWIEVTSGCNSFPWRFSPLPNGNVSWSHAGGSNEMRIASTAPLALAYTENLPPEYASARLTFNGDRLVVTGPYPCEARRAN